jgi:hypothetical protein
MATAALMHLAQRAGARTRRRRRRRRKAKRTGMAAKCLSWQ